ncbi:MAG: ribonuclease III family protein [Candidatus Hodarchaeales archaeon]
MDEETLQELKNDLAAIIKKQGWKSEDGPFPLSVLHNQGNAKLGDGFVNFLFSMAKSLCQERTTGLKVADSVLSEAYRQSSLSKHVKLKGNKDILGDKVEALLLWTWLSGYMDLMEMTAILRDNIDPSSLKHHKTEKLTSIVAFTALFNAIEAYLFQKKG